MKFTSLRPLKRIIWTTLEPYAKRRLIRNGFGTNYGRRALLSYVVYPFVLPVRSLSHTNVVESRLMAHVLSEMGYDVDIIHYDNQRSLNYQDYDLIVGFGDPILDAFHARKDRAVVVNFMAAMHPYYQNRATIKRIKEVHSKKGEWLLGSGRYVRKDWAAASALADAIIVSGNNETAESYRLFTNSPVLIVPVTYHTVFESDTILAERQMHSASTNFLWFGGHGLIHKGLDLVLEAFRWMPGYDLHVCGPIKDEPAFEACFHQELKDTPNIHCHDFVSLRSSRFRELLKRCVFVIFASCAEGGSVSVVTAAANGGLVPVVSNASAVNIGDFGLQISDLTVQSVQEAVSVAANLSSMEIRHRAQAAAAYYQTAHSAQQFYNTFKEHMVQVMDESGYD